MRSDVCLILEGSYPYVVGGVSTWTHHLIKSLPEFTFALVYVGVSKHQVQRMEYKLPDNVNQFHEIYLLDDVEMKTSRRRNLKRAWQVIEQFVGRFREGDISGFHDVVDVLTRGDTQITAHDVLHSKQYWDLITGLYRKHFSTLSFIDYFWTCRFLLLPLFQLMYAPIPEARLYHATCTGYAGLMAALAHRKYDAPCLLTEHGIYTKERMIEVSQAPYIYNEVVVDYVPRPDLSALQSVWMGKFNMLAQIAYQEASRIVTLYEGNRQTQIEHGADPDKCLLIPNGIDVSRYRGLAELRARIDRPPGFHVCYVGRISPIKDVKTYIRSARIVLDQMEDVTFYVLGTPDEDVEYYEECRALAELMDLGDRLRFMGNVDMGEYYPLADVVVLTSVSEAQPFVALEAMAVGVPVVATNVGACAELLYGGTDEDRKLGEAGVITNVNSPEETANAVMEMLRKPKMRERMGAVGRERSKMFYQRQDVFDRYRGIYKNLMNQTERRDRRRDESGVRPMPRRI
ncbi:MAG: glycosyltransferase involved in cell wall biosynthesis [Myxococcota bacterium]